MKEKLKAIFDKPRPLDLSAKLSRYACVAVIIRGKTIDDFEVGFIQRAFHPEDRWSGQLAFPGGKKEEQDLTDLDTAIRETLEEVGVDLQKDELVGRLDDIQARKSSAILDFYIRPFVFYSNREFSIILDASEVADYFWIPLKELQNPTRQSQYLHEGAEVGYFPLPALFLGRDIPLWGLTYMMVLNLIDRLHRLTLLQSH